MNKKVRWITETAVMLALLVALQALTKGFGQFVTGSCVNAVLAVTVLTAGMGSGIVVAVLSPVLAYLLGIAPQILVLPAIMVGNTVFVVLLRLIAGTDSRKVGQQIAAWLIAALAKFAVLYLIVVKVVCGVMAPSLLAAGQLKGADAESPPRHLQLAAAHHRSDWRRHRSADRPRHSQGAAPVSIYAKFKRGHRSCPRFPLFL